MCCTDNQAQEHILLYSSCYLYIEQAALFQLTQAQAQWSNMLVASVLIRLHPCLSRSNSADCAVRVLSISTCICAIGGSRASMHLRVIISHPLRCFAGLRSRSTHLISGAPICKVVHVDKTLGPLTKAPPAIH